MKKLLTYLLVSSAIIANAQSDKYQAAMETSIAAIDSAFKSPESLNKLANKFERIALAEKNQWEPYYYSAFLELNAAFQQAPDQYDAIADKAEKSIEIANSYSENNSEISVLKSMVATLRMLVNPMQRFQVYGPEIEKNIQKAMAQDESNPRPYFLKAQNLKNTPENFGGGCASAKSFMDTANEKFENFEPASVFSPTWGKVPNDALIKSCE